MPPMTSMTRSASARTPSKSPRERVRTPVIRGRIPVACSTWSARAGRSSANAPPTVPWPSRPIRKSDIAPQRVGVGPAPHDGAGVAARAEDPGRPRHAVVVVRHRVGVGAGGGRDDVVAGGRIREGHLPHEDVAELAVLAGDAAALRWVGGRLAGSAREPRLVAG